MTNKQKKVHINIKGKLKNHLYKVFAFAKAKSLGLKTHGFNQKADGTVELVVQGYVDKLWGMINWSKKGYVFFFVEEVVFKFAD